MKFFRYTILFLLLVIHSISYSQNTVNTKKKESSVKAFNFSLGWSFGPVNSMPGYTDPILQSQISKRTGLSSEYCDNIATASLGISIEFSELLEFETVFAFSHNHGRLKYDDGRHVIHNYTMNYTEDWFTLMPGIKVNWFRKNIIPKRNGKFILYSKAAIGLSLADRYELLEQAGTINAKGAFAFQVVPIGLELGTQKFRFFCEGGFGYTGYIRTGVRLRVLRDRNDEGLDSDKWYKDYLKM